MKPRSKAVWGWAIYDWANSAFATTVMAGFFPLFFKQYWSAGADVNLSTARLGLANSLASLLVALAAPVLGAMADLGGARKRFLALFAYMGALMTGCLFWVQSGQWQLASVFYIAGVIGFSGANVFYDALLPQLADESGVDFVSGLGFSLGYLGGGLLFLANVLMVTHPGWFGLLDSAQAVKVSFASVAVWWAAFTIFTLLWVTEPRPAKKTGALKAARRGLAQLADTLRKARGLKQVMLFLAAYWLYIDGVDTIIRMAVDYGLSLGFDSNQLITALLITQFVGFPSALAFGKLAGKIGVRRSLYLAIAVYVLVCLYAMTMTRALEFFILAVAIGLVQGGIQALSRSYFTRLIPKSQSAQFFGFYNMLGKFAAILGPVMMGASSLFFRWWLSPPGAMADEASDSQRLAARLGLGSVVILFLAGAALLSRVDEEKGRQQARLLEQQQAARRAL